MKTQQPVSRFIQQHPWQIGCVLGLGFLNNLLSFGLTVAVGEFFTLLYHTGGGKSRLFGMLGIHLPGVTAFFIFYSSLLLLKLVVEYAETYATATAGEKLARELRQQLFACQVQQSAEVFGRKRYQHYLLRYSNDMKSVQQLLTRGILGNIRDGLFMVMGITLLFLVHAPGAGAFLLLVVLTLLLLFMLYRRQRERVLAARDHRSSLLAFVARQFARQNRLQAARVIDRFNYRSAGLYKANLAQRWYESAAQSLIPLAQFGGLLLFMILIALGNVHSTAADALVFAFIILLLRAPLKRMLKSPGIINKGTVSLQKIQQLMQEAEQPPQTGLPAATVPSPITSLA